MKSRLLNILSIVILLMYSCTYEAFSPNDWAISPELSFSTDNIIFSGVNTNGRIGVFTNYESFVVNSDSDDWCNVTADQITSSINISVTPNPSTQPRTATLVVSISRGIQTLSKNISVMQMGNSNEIIGDFSVNWSYDISTTTKVMVEQLLKTMVYVEGGSFIMGDTDEDIVDSATPHEVMLSDFYISKFEITQNQWMAIMGNNPSKFKSLDHPIENICWNDALEFVTRLSKLTNLEISFPTEAQWEYAARGGKNSMNYVYPGSDNYKLVAVTQDGQLDIRTNPIGSLSPNELGLYDMAGNVSEFCNDWYEMYYVSIDEVDPEGPRTGIFKCVRGGSIYDKYYTYRNTNRQQWIAPDETGLIGLRIVIKI